jgi:tetratricopeptide (TPR) repeat protein
MRARWRTQSGPRELARVPEDRRRFLSALLALTSGVAESRRGRIGAARRHLDVMRQLYATAPASADRWWEHLLAGEIALAEGDLATASAEWVRARPVRRAFFSRLAEGSVLSNDLVFRDGAARLARARGDIRGAIVEYRRLLTHGPDQPWVALFEPRYVLELGRLLEQAGDRASARDEYRRFLQLWSRADSDLPELAEAKRSDARLSGQAAR